MLEGFKTSAIVTVKRENVINIVRASGYLTYDDGKVELHEYTLDSVPCDLTSKDQLRVVDALMNAAYRQNCKL